MESQPWSVLEKILCLKTKWFTLWGERLQVPHGPELEYWRIGKADSVIVLPIQADQILVPPAFYRPGVGSMTVDLPGGCCPQGETPAQAVVKILQRELNLPEWAIASVVPLTSTGWAINSSFSNQKLYGFVAQIRPDWTLTPESVGATYIANSAGLNAMLSIIQCAQCRLILREWQVHQLLTADAKFWGEAS